jgi:mutator protein MutT
MDMEDRQQMVVVLGAVRDAAGRILLARRIEASVPEAQNRWELPGGKINFGETPEAAVTREVSEETGLVVRVSRLLPRILTNVWRAESDQEIHVVLITYECHIEFGELSLENVRDEIGELKFFTLQEAAFLDCLPNVSETLNLLQ